MTVFTEEQIKVWLEKQDSLGDAHYNCKAEKIFEANFPPVEDEDDDEVDDDEDTSALPIDKDFDGTDFFNGRSNY